MTRILVTGLPRSGTTWVASMLARTEGTVLLMEPDNHFTAPFALRAKRGLPGGFYTTLEPGDRAPAYERLWDEAFGERGNLYSQVERARRAIAQRLYARENEQALRSSLIRGPTPGLRVAARMAVPERPTIGHTTLVKSVYATQAMEWITARTDVQVVVVRRDLRNLISSWIELGWGLDDDELAAADPELLTRRNGVAPNSPLGRLTWLLAVLSRDLKCRAAAHEQWHVVMHEELAAQAPERLRELAENLGLEWGPDADDAVAASDRPGSGYAIERVASSLPEIWRTRLSDEQLEEIAAVLASVEARSSGN